MRWKTFNLIPDGLARLSSRRYNSSPRWNDVPTVIPIVAAVLAAAIATYWVPARSSSVSESVVSGGEHGMNSGGLDQQRPS